MGTDLKVGDFVIFEFKIGEIRKMEGTAIVGVSDGVCSTASNDLSDRIVPLTMRNKQIADEYEYYSARIHREGSAGLNYPDIHRWLVEAWRTACDHPDDLKPHFEKLRTFAHDVLSAQDIDSGYGFQLLRRRA